MARRNSQRSTPPSVQHALGSPPWQVSMRFADALEAPWLRLPPEEGPEEAAASIASLHPAPWTLVRVASGSLHRTLHAVSPSGNLLPVPYPESWSTYGATAPKHVVASGSHPFSGPCKRLPEFSRQREARDFWMETPRGDLVDFWERAPNPAWLMVLAMGIPRDLLRRLIAGLLRARPGSQAQQVAVQRIAEALENAGDVSLHLDDLLSAATEVTDCQFLPWVATPPRPTPPTVVRFTLDWTVSEPPPSSLVLRPFLALCSLLRAAPAVDKTASAANLLDVNEYGSSSSTAVPEAILEARAKAADLVRSLVPLSAVLASLF